VFLSETDDGGEADVPEERIDLAQHALNLITRRPVISGGLELLVMPLQVYAAAITHRANIQGAVVRRGKHKRVVGTPSCELTPAQPPSTAQTG